VTGKFKSFGWSLSNAYFNGPEYYSLLLLICQLIFSTHKFHGWFRFDGHWHPNTVLRGSAYRYRVQNFTPHLGSVISLSLNFALIMMVEIEQ
jgi:hypothetical protein